MHHKGPVTFPPPIRHPRYHAALGLLVTACFMLQVIGCAHSTTEQTPSPSKSTTKGSSQQPARAGQPDSTKAVEKKSSAAADSTPGKKLEQSEKSNPDTFAPPPPLKPPTFGGAGG